MYTTLCNNLGYYIGLISITKMPCSNTNFYSNISFCQHVVINMDDAISKFLINSNCFEEGLIQHVIKMVMKIRMCDQYVYSRVILQYCRLTNQFVRGKMCTDTPDRTDQYIFCQKPTDWSAYNIEISCFAEVPFGWDNIFTMYIYMQVIAYCVTIIYRFQ